MSESLNDGDLAIPVSLLDALATAAMRNPEWHLLQQGYVLGATGTIAEYEVVIESARLRPRPQGGS